VGRACGTRGGGRGVYRVLVPTLYVSKKQKNLLSQKQTNAIGLSDCNTFAIANSKDTHSFSLFITFIPLCWFRFYFLSSFVSRCPS
jgi:hypothetical protein